MRHPFTGAGVALVTPFNENKSVDFGALERLVEDQIAGGTDYLVVMGTTGEPPTLSDAEKKEVIRFIVKQNAGRLKIMLGMASNNTLALVETIKNTDFEGIDAILSVTPYYNKPTQEGLFQHFKAVVEVSPLPVVLYNVPGRTGVNMEADTTLRIARLSEKVIGVKEACGDIGQFTKIANGAPDYFKVISGDDSLTLPAIVTGSIGIISVLANAMPEKLAQLTHAALEGNMQLAGKLHLQLAEMMKLIFKEGSPAGVKALMELRGKAKHQVRLPLVQVSEATYGLIEAEFNRIK